MTKNDYVEYDYDGDFDVFQRQLDAAGVEFDITNLAGATLSEIRWTVERLLAAAQKKAGATSA